MGPGYRILRGPACRRAIPGGIRRGGLAVGSRLGEYVDMPWKDDRMMLRACIQGVTEVKRLSTGEDGILALLPQDAKTSYMGSDSVCHDSQMKGEGRLAYSQQCWP